ncbi:hypothetical protein ACFT08_31240 [Streptomyces rochei]|uniref:hypothetical protein n=1 Tax=Streptomyces rochei TaxID=1928 RepID=UPI00364067EC
MRVRIEGLAHADGFQLAQGFSDVLVVLGEELLREVDDGAGDALRRVRPGLPPQIRSEVTKTPSRSKVSSHGSPAFGPGSAVTGTTMRSARRRASSGIRGSAPANSRAVSMS